MPYPYGTQNAPVVGNGLGGLPRRSSGSRGKSVDYYWTSASAGMVNFTIPLGYSKYRVSLIGNGGCAQAGGASGSGGACAVSPVMPAIAGSIVTCNFAAVTTTFGAKSTHTVIFSSQMMSAESGSGSNIGATGGNAVGGEFNFKGGDSTVVYPGAGASPDGPGGNATNSAAGIPAGGANTLGSPMSNNPLIGASPGGGARAGVFSGEDPSGWHAGGPALLRIELW